MLKRLAIFVAVVAAITLAAAFAKAQEQPATPQVQALSEKLSQEINNSLQCLQSVASLRQQTIEAKAEVTRLTEKYEPKAPEKKK